MKPAAAIIGQLVRDVLCCDEALTHESLKERQLEFERFAAQAAPGSMGNAVAKAAADRLAHAAQGLQPGRAAR